MLIRQKNSVNHKELQAVAAVSWAFFQKYEREDDRFYDIITPKVILEEVIMEKDWSDGEKKKNPLRGGI